MRHQGNEWVKKLGQLFKVRRDLAKELDAVEVALDELVMHIPIGVVGRKRIAVF